MSSVSRVAGVAGSFTYRLSTTPFSAPTFTIYSDSPRTIVAVAPAVLAGTGDPQAFTALYPSSLAAGTYYLRFSTVITSGQAALVDIDDTLVLEAVSGAVGGDVDLLTLAEAKAALNIAVSDTSNDTELAQVITAASRFVDSVYGPVVQRAVTKTVLEPSGRIWLDRPAAITTVTEYSGGVATVLTAEDFDTAGTYRLDTTQGTLLRRSSWGATSWGTQELVVAYTSGRYANTAAVDAKFKEAAVVALIHFWQHRGANSGAATFGGDGAPFGGVPFSSAQLRSKLIALFPEEWTGPAVA